MIRKYRSRLSSLRYLSHERMVKNLLVKAPSLTKKQVEEALQTFLNILSVALAKGYRLKIENLGSLRVVRRRYLYNVAKQKYEVFYRSSVRFQPSYVILKDINYQDEEDLDDIFN